MCCVDTVRNEVLPSIDIARKIADILEVSLNYLTGKEDVQIDKDTSSSILRYLNLKRLTKTISSPLLMHLLLKGKYNLFYNKRPTQSSWSFYVLSVTHYKSAPSGYVFI